MSQNDFNNNIRLLMDNLKNNEDEILYYINEIFETTLFSLTDQSCNISKYINKYKVHDEIFDEFIIRNKNFNIGISYREVYIKQKYDIPNHILRFEPNHDIDLDEEGYFNFCLTNTIECLTYDDIIFLTKISKMAVEKW